MITSIDRIHGIGNYYSYDGSVSISNVILNNRETTGKLLIMEQEQQIYKFAVENGSITTAQVTKLLGVKQRRGRDKDYGQAG